MVLTRSTWRGVHVAGDGGEVMRHNDVSGGGDHTPARLAGVALSDLAGVALCDLAGVALCDPLMDEVMSCRRRATRMHCMCGGHTHALHVWGPHTCVACAGGMQLGDGTYS